MYKSQKIDYNKNEVANLPGGFHLRKGVVIMSTYETISLMIAFGVLIVMIMGTKK